MLGGPTLENLSKKETSDAGMFKGRRMHRNSKPAWEYENGAADKTGRRKKVDCRLTS
jgi:hypothetical protein